MIGDLAKVFIPAALAFTVGIALAPVLTHYLYRYKAWKKIGGKRALDGSTAVEFGRLKAEGETKTPRMGGILVWAATACVTLGLFALARLTALPFFTKLDFLSRSQTWIPFFALIAGALMGLANDLLDVLPEGARGIRLRTRLLFVAAVSLVIGWWFYAKLGVTGVAIPFDGVLGLGPLFVPFFVVLTLALYAGGIIDGIDGLAGGVFAVIFGSYAVVAFSQDQINLAALCATLFGALLAFLWFNVPPARFWMTETGTMGLTMAIASIAFLTDLRGGGHGVAALGLIALPLFVTVLSNVLQVLSKKFRGKKLFRIAPLHHHFEAIGWPSYKVAMRYWILAIICGIFGITLALFQ